MKKIGRLIAVVSFLAAAVLFLYFFKSMLNLDQQISMFYRAVVAFVVSILLLIGGFALAKTQDNKDRAKQIMQLTLFVVFIYYMSQLMMLLFFDPRYRNIYNTTSIKEYFDTHHNLVPFKSIMDYWKALRINPDMWNSFFINIIGNIIAFVPFGLMLPILFSSMRKVQNFLFVILVSLFLVEGMQIVLRVGAFDVDDIIMNFAGAIVGYFIIRIFQMIHDYRMNKRRTIFSKESKDPEIFDLWEKYLNSINEDISTTERELLFSPMSDDLVRKVIQGEKQAIASFEKEYKSRKEFPKVDDYTLLETDDKKEKCIVKTKQVNVIRWNEVTEEMAQLDGADTLSSWRERMQLRNKKLKIQEDTLVLFEWIDCIVSQQDES